MKPLHSVQAKKLEEKAHEGKLLFFTSVRTF